MRAWRPDVCQLGRRASPWCSAKSVKSLRFKVASGRSQARQQAAIQVSLTGRGLPRWVAAADSSSQITAMGLPPGMTGLSASQPSSIARLAGPQERSLVHWVISPTVTNVSSGCRPSSRAARAGVSRPLKDREATPVSRTTALAAPSGKVGVP